MKKLTTEGIVLLRRNYSEADKIIIFLTPSYGKVNVIAKGVRKQKSKMSGGIEVFSVSEISFIQGKSELKTLVSARLKENFSNIVKDLDKSTVGFEIIKTINRITDDHPGIEYYEVLQKSFRALNNLDNNILKIELWFYAHLLWLEGHTPNLASDSTGNQLSADRTYSFDFQAMTFAAHPDAEFNASHIKLLRIAIGKDPQLLQKVEVAESKVLQTLRLLKNIYSYNK